LAFKKLTLKVFGLKLFFTEIISFLPLNLFSLVSELGVENLLEFQLCLLLILLVLICLDEVVDTFSILDLLHLTKHNLINKYLYEKDLIFC